MKVLLILSFLVCGYYAELADYRLTAYANLGLSSLECTEAGQFCESCTSRVLCEVVDGKWQKFPLEHCKSPEKCLRGQCVEESDPICDGTAYLEFKCARTGIFPDPFYWNKYVLCVNVGNSLFPNLRPFVSECEKGFLFDIQTGRCTLRTDQQPRLYPVPLCTNVGQSGSLYESEAYYYVCRKYGIFHDVLYPELSFCDGEGIYINNQCL